MGKKKLSKNYSKYRDYKYCVAFDCKTTITDNDSDIVDSDKYYSDYIGFNTLEELKKYCKDIRNNNVYLLINKSVVKPYFDIDKSNLIEEELETIIHKIIIGFRDIFNVKIDRSDFIIETTNDYPYKSIHIVIKSVKVNMSELKLFCNSYLIDNEVDIDCKVYNKYRQFKLCGMWKLKKDITNKLYNHKSNLDIDFNDTIITNTNKCKLVVIDNETKIKLNKINVEKEKDYVKKISENTTEKLIEYIDCDLITNLMNDLDSSFFDSNNDWTKITKMIIRDLNYESVEVKRELMKNWCRVSVERSNKDCYSYEENMKYINEMNSEKLGFISMWSINTFINKLNKYLDYKLIVKRKNITYEMKEYIKNYTGLSIDTIDKCISDTNLNTDDYVSFNFKDNDNNYWDIKNQYLVWKNKLYNYNEIEYIRRIDSLDYELVFSRTIDNVKDLEKYNKDLVNKEIDCLIVKSKWGSGKSHYGMRLVIEKLIEKKCDCSILIITENNSLNSEVKSKYSKWGFKSHTDNNWEETNRLIISVESSIKINDYDWDLVILDEYETILNQYESEKTFMNVGVENIDREDILYHNYLNLKKLIMESGRLLVMDADISKNRIDWLKEIKCGKYESVYMDINNFKNCNFNQYVNEEDWNTKLYNDFNTKNMKLIISSNKKKTINRYFRTLKELNKINNDKVILCITGEGAEIDIRVKTSDNEWVSKKYTDNNGNDISNEDLKNLIKNDIESFLKENKVDILLYTPSIKTGISIDSQYFNKHYSYGSSGSVNCRTYNQMLFRARDLIDSEFNIYISGSYKLNGYCSIDRMGLIFMNMNYTIMNENHKSGIFSVMKKDLENMKNDNHYFKLRMNNKVENYNSNNNFNSDFITKLKLIHKLNHNYIVSENDISIEMECMIDKVKNMVVEERLELLVNTELINCYDYKEIMNKVNENKRNKDKKQLITYNEWIEKYKYEMLVGCYDMNNCKSYENRYRFKQLEKLWECMRDYGNCMNTDINVLRDSKRYLDYRRLDSDIGKIMYSVKSLKDNDKTDKLKSLLETLETKMNIYHNVISDYITNNDYNEEIYDILDTKWYEYKKSKINELVDKYDCDRNKYYNVEELILNGNLIDRDYYNKNDNYECLEDMCEYGKCDNDNIYWDKVNEKWIYLLELGDIYENEIIRNMNDYCFDKIKNDLVEKYSSYELINHKEFYRIWDCSYTRDKWYKSKIILNTGEIKVNEEIEIDNDMVMKVNKSMKEKIVNGYIRTLLKLLNITDIRLEYSYTNKEFRRLLIDNYEKLLELDNDYNENYTEKNIKTIKINDFRSEIRECMNEKDKKKINTLEKKIVEKYKKIIYYMNDWLGKINVRIKYMDKNTNKDYGKLKIGFNENHYFNSELDKSIKLEYREELDILNRNMIVNNNEKFKKGFRTREKCGFCNKENKTTIYKNNGSKKNKIIRYVELDKCGLCNIDSWRLYKYKELKNIRKKKDNDITKLIEINYNDISEIDFGKYIDNDLELMNNEIEDTERIDNYEKLSNYKNPLTEEIMKMFWLKNSPVIVKNELVENNEVVLNECMIED